MFLHGDRWFEVLLADVTEFVLMHLDVVFLQGGPGHRLIAFWAFDNISRTV